MIVLCSAVYAILAEVVKKDGQLLMTGKAYNNRVIAEWLHDVVRRVRRNSADPRMPVAYVCMMLGLQLVIFFFCDDAIAKG